jgi:hypothetical protein
VVEHRLAKARVASSNLVFRSSECKTSVRRRRLTEVFLHSATGVAQENSSSDSLKAGEERRTWHFSADLPLAGSKADNIYHPAFYQYIKEEIT